MGYLILFDEEKNIVEIQYEGVNAALLAEINIRLTNLENEVASDNTNEELDELEDDINSLMTLVQAQSSALTQEIEDRTTGDINLTETFTNELIDQQQEYSAMIQLEAEIRGQAILDEATARGAAIAESEAVIMTDVAILATTVEGLATEMGAAQSSIIEVQDSLVTETMARTAQYSALQADYADTNAAILEESVARSSEDEALAYQISLIEASVGDNYAAILAEQVARVNADEALASDISALAVTVGSNSAAIIAEQSARIAADGSIEAKYSVKVDVNGHVSGFDLISTANVNNTPYSKFVFNSTSFEIYNGIGPIAPFQVVGGTVRMQDVIIGNAVIENLAVTGSKIDNLAVDTPKIQNNAVTVNVSVETVTPTPGTGSTAIVGSASITNTSGVDMQVVVLITTNQEFTSGTHDWEFWSYVYQGGVSVRTVTGPHGLYFADSIAFQFNDTVPAGQSRTYYLVWRTHTSVIMERRVITLLGVKK